MNAATRQAEAEPTFTIDQSWMAWCVHQAGYGSCGPMEPGDVATVVRDLERRRIGALREADETARNLVRARAEIAALRAVAPSLTALPPCEGPTCGLRFGAHVDDCPALIAARDAAPTAGQVQR